MGEQVAARSKKKKTTGWKPDEDKTGIGKESCRKQDGARYDRQVSANPYQPGRAVDINWFTSD